MATYDDNRVLRDCLASVSRPIEKAVHLNENLTRAQNKVVKDLNKTKIRKINHLHKMEQNITKKLEAKGLLDKHRKCSPIEDTLAIEKERLQEAILKLRTFSF